MLEEQDIGQAALSAAREERDAKGLYLTGRLASGGKLEKLQNGLYLLRADTDQISIEIKKGES